MSLTLRVLATDQNVFDGSADEVILPSTTGQLGILPGHISLLTAIDEAAAEAFMKDLLSSVAAEASLAVSGAAYAPGVHDLIGWPQYKVSDHVYNNPDQAYSIPDAFIVTVVSVGENQPEGKYQVRKHTTVGNLVDTIFRKYESGWGGRRVIDDDSGDYGLKVAGLADYRRGPRAPRSRCHQQTGKTSWGVLMHTGPPGVPPKRYALRL